MPRRVVRDAPEIGATPSRLDNHPPEPVDTNYDYSQYVDEASVSAIDKGDALARLSKLAQEQLDAEADVALAQAALARAQEKLKDVSERQIPELMADVGMANFKTTSGLVISVEDSVRASPPKARRDEAWAWLRANGAAGLIKRVVSIEFGKGEDDKAKTLVTDLEKKFDLVKDEAGVHPSTLSAFVREQLKKGSQIPLDVFGVFTQKVAKIGKPK